MLGRWCLLSLLILLAGCGFQLRGLQPSLALTLESINVSGGSDSTRLSLEQDLSRNGVSVTTLSPLQLLLSNERQSKRTNVVDKQGRAAGYEMHHTLDWQLRRADGLLLIPASTVTVTQSMSIDPTNALATTDEESVLRRQMRDRLIDQLKRQLGNQLVNYQSLIDDALQEEPVSP